MILIFVIASLIISYLIGSVPTALWYGQRKFDLDIREHGSGNAGATNTFRVLGRKAGSFVMAIDVLKGFIAASLPVIGVSLGLVEFANEAKEVNVQLACGVMAVIGHIFPLYANFKGGKGVASLLGVILAVNIWAALACLGVFMIVFLISKYVSLGSMLAGLTFPLLLLIPFFHQFSPSNFLKFFGFVLAVLLVYTHRKNIRRLLDGEENKIQFSLRRNK
jgi:acyl phosphate:glycerol-3-phosphate acyltransferase